MSELQLTAHALSRLRQRGHRERDLDLVADFGTATDGAIVLTRNDVARAVAECRRLIGNLERLSGTAVFTAGPRVKTVFRPTPGQMGQLLGGKPRMHRVRRRRSRAR
ncbi:MAG: hypothetical protein QF890_10130 [Myxococcota bacterium]|jgi:hypothetical protein|nr:hypothetical protein [bacterium]MDP6075277.1 hypothetical protein [Myxococcota bacterium]MDP6244686.1 hypothetical protein [Myxococcota bacterium]MDP7074870.1 hypothetical protein [Myxococcota bacterium]MDP7301338.1 hypothetical protein [Myxococcota bacterium]